MESSKFVKRVRSKLGLSQVEFGAALGVERRTIMRYEAGGPLPERSRLAILRLLEQKPKRRTHK
jgi:DNA-binding transcriptional regulator YiaG